MRSLLLRAAGMAALLMTSHGVQADPPTPSTARVLDMDTTSRVKRGAELGGRIPTQIYVNVGGDTIESAMVIPGLPFMDSGSTCDFTHQYDEVCPYELPGAPDVVYRFTPSQTTITHVSLCDSAFDTKLYIYDNAVDVPIACNDDACGADGFRSELDCVSLAAGNTYYIVVDGWSASECGNYELVVTECPDCYLTCPAVSQLENESECEDDWIDSENGGCDSDTPNFSPIFCGGEEVLPICGTYGGFFVSGLPARDTDWYRVFTHETSNVRFCLSGEYDSLFGILDGNVDCPVQEFLVFGYAAPCDENCLEYTIPAGWWLFFVATSGFGPTAGACGGDYTMTIEGLQCHFPDAVEPSSWGSLKSLYR